MNILENNFMSLKKARVGLGAGVLLMVLSSLTTGDFLSSGFWYFLSIILGVYTLLDMTTAAAAVGVKGVELQEVKSKKLVYFERWFLGLAIVSWAGVSILEASSLRDYQWAPITANILTALSIGLIIKFLDIEWTLMGKNFEENKWGTFSLGFLIMSISAGGILTTPQNELLAVSTAKIMLSLGISILFAFSSRYIDLIVDLPPKK